MKLNARSFSSLLLSVFLLLVSSISLATEDDNLNFNIYQDYSYRSPLPPSEIYSRTQSVLNYYKSPILPTGQNELSHFDNLQSFDGLKNILKYFDMKKMFNKLFDASNTEFKGFDDFEGNSKLNFKVSLQTSALKRESFLQKNIQNPLLGLRIAIDPGHMGEEFWDQTTGKYIRDNKGNYLSEGVLNLQVSLLLQKELEALGAQVVLTRTEMGPATDMDINELPVAKFARRELLEHVYSSWFLKLLSTGTGNVLFKAFDTSKDRQKLWSPTYRYNYFILKEDLWARARKINNFKPDIVLIIHFDTSPNTQPHSDEHGINSKSPNQTKVFVSGGYFDTEFGSRMARTQFAKKLLNKVQWENSIRLSQNIIREFRTQMRLGIPKEAENSIPVKPGVFARNLTLPRFLEAPAVSYMECLFYSRPEEFYALSDTKYPLMINGINYPYSDRLRQVVNSIKQGVIAYSKKY